MTTIPQPATDYLARLVDSRKRAYATDRGGLLAWATGGIIGLSSLVALNLPEGDSGITCYEDEARIQWGGREVCEPVDNLPITTQQGVNWTLAGGQ